MDKRKAHELAENFALGHVLAGDIPNITFFEITSQLRGDKNEDYGLCELYENCFYPEQAADYIEELARDVYGVIAQYVRGETCES